MQEDNLIVLFSRMQLPASPLEGHSSRNPHPLPSTHIHIALIKLTLAIVTVENPHAICVQQQMNFCGRRANIDRPTHHAHLYAGSIL